MNYYDGYYDCEETDRAVKLYYARARRIGGPDADPPAPGRVDSGRDGDIITLGNVTGVLARYRVQPDGRLRRLRRLADA
jgi:hypothetical protein